MVQLFCLKQVAGLEGKEIAKGKDLTLSSES